jgi:cytochrome b subunit of formate dehydrogenase
MSSEPRTFERFPLARRIEHFFMLTSFGLLGLTGLPQRFPTYTISIWIANLFGSVETLRLVHHTSAVIMMLGTVWHIIVFGYKFYVDRTRLSMLPSFQDAKDAIQSLMYNFGVAKTRPQMGRFTFEEKMEYWAFVWGAAVMGITGFMMWNPISTTRFLPGEFIPAAKAAHGGEAVLAVAAIILWHFYGVHIKMFNKSMWTGKMSEEEMLHEHPLELADLKAGIKQHTVDPAVIQKRKAIYFPIAGALTAIMLFLIYGFVSLENTVPLTTIRTGESAQIYSVPTPTPAPTAASTGPASLTWADYVSPLFQKKCAMCHGTAAGLSLATQADLLKGGKSGPGYIAGDGANSVVYMLQASGGHAGQLNPEQLEYLKQWIDSGAP